MNYTEFIQNLKTYISNNHFIHSQKPIASVLVPIFEKNDEPWILLTKRSTKLEKHSGQVSFPGGKVDITDRDEIDTALRETKEELNISKGQIEIIGRWHDFWTPYYRDVATIIGEVKNLDGMTPSESEIEKIISLPVSSFADPSIHRVEERYHNGITYTVHYFEINGDVIWGATGGVIFFLLRDLGIIKYGKQYSGRRSGLT